MRFIAQNHLACSNSDCSCTSYEGRLLIAYSLSMKILDGEVRNNQRETHGGQCTPDAGNLFFENIGWKSHHDFSYSH